MLILSYNGILSCNIEGIIPNGLFVKYSYNLVSLPISTTLQSAHTLPKSIKANTDLHGADKG